MLNMQQKCQVEGKEIISKYISQFMWNDSYHSICWLPDIETVQFSFKLWDLNGVTEDSAILDFFS